MASRRLKVLIALTLVPPCFYVLYQHCKVGYTPKDPITSQSFTALDIPNLSERERLLQYITEQNGTPKKRGREPAQLKQSDQIKSLLTGQRDSAVAQVRKQHEPVNSGYEDGASLRQKAISRALKNIDKCMYASNLTSPALLAQSRQNAQLFMKQYGSVVSQDYLPGYINHCYKTEYKLSLDWRKIRGKIGKTHFTGLTSNFWFGMATKIYIEKNYGGSFSSSTVCLPNVYLLGFEKCGSTFFWCLMSKTLNNGKTMLQADKEPYFWTDFGYKIERPDPANLATRYIPMFLRGSDEKIPARERKEMTFIDACPSTVFEWPKFTETEQELTNYCLLPSALPELFPTSKYLVIMRNPVKMMYSSFWWSFFFPPRNSPLGRTLRNDFTKGPRVFHLRAGEKIARFLKCVNSHLTTVGEKQCTIWGRAGKNFAECITNRVHLLSQCVANVTNEREFLEAVIHRGIFYVHVRKWLQTVPRERIFFTTLERLAGDTQSVVREAYKFLKGSELYITDKQIRKLKYGCRENTNIVNYHKPSLEMLQSTKTMLEKFFEPFNKLLSELLEDEQFLWNGA